MNNKLLYEYSSEDIVKLDYVSFMALIDETNRPPGGKDSIRRIVINSFLNENSKILHIGCNTGYSSFEIARLAKCYVTGIDINSNMILSAIKRRDTEVKEIKNKLNFLIADAQNLPFENETFDLVMSAGSMAFVSDREQAIRECIRVCKPYGFVADTFLFYVAPPPADIIERLNKAIGIVIQPWDENFWISLYRNSGLEIFYKYTTKMNFQPADEDVQNYCEAMLSRFSLSSEQKKASFQKLLDYMNLFTENHKYLGYSVLICRKQIEPEQPTLFGV